MTTFPQRLCVPLSLALGLVASPRAQDAATETVVEKTGEHFVLRFHGGDEALAQSALDAVEASWPLATAILGGEKDDPAQPLAVHLYRTIDGYVAADRRLTQGKFERNLAMTVFDPRESHVALQPPCRDEVLRAGGLPGLTLALLAWEATHLVRCERLRNFADHPAWFVDGLAAHVAAQVLEQIHASGGSDAAPFSATRAVRVQRLLQDKKLPDVEAILAGRIDDLDIHPRYAVRAVFFDFLCENRSRLAKVVDVVRRTGGGDKYQATVLTEVRKLLGTSVQRDFEKYLRGLRPQWDEVFRSLSTAGHEWTQIAFPETNAIAWRTEPVKGSFSARGTLRILPGEKQQMNFLLARSDAGFYSIAFVADGAITVFDYQSADDQWIKIGTQDVPGLRLGYGSKFAVEAKDRGLVVHVDDQHWEFTLPRPLPKEIVWGVGVQSGGAGIWTDVTVGAPAK